MKVSKDGKFIQVRRMNADSRETWNEVIRLDSIKAIHEHRTGKQTYGGNPGRRRGYDIFLDGGQWGSFWINDSEYAEILKLLGFDNEEKIK